MVRDAGADADLPLVPPALGGIRSLEKSIRELGSRIRLGSFKKNTNGQDLFLNIAGCPLISPLDKTWLLLGIPNFPVWWF